MSSFDESFYNRVRSEAKAVELSPFMRWAEWWCYTIPKELINSLVREDQQMRIIHMDNIRKYVGDIDQYDLWMPLKYRKNVHSELRIAMKLVVLK